MRNLVRLALLAATTASACNWEGQYCEGDWNAVPDEDAPSMRQSQVVAQVLPVETKAVDILFVIDDSRSMTDEQQQLGVWSREMFDVLSSSGEMPDLHVAVTSSSVAINGLAGCETGGSFHTGGALTKGQYLIDVAGPSGRERNFSGTLYDAFAKMALVGDSGCGFEQSFKAARLALRERADAEGFLRDDALLLVVFVTDEDDCSTWSGDAMFGDQYADACSELGVLTSYRCFEQGVICADGKGSREFGERRNCRPNESSKYIEWVGGFADYLMKLKKNPAQIIVAGIYGKPNHIAAIPDEKIDYVATPRLANVCGASGEEGEGATPAVRMNALMAKFGGRASQSSICDSELSWAMRDVGLVTRTAATRSHCLRGALTDIDSAAAGVQPTCRVEVATDMRTTLEKRVVVPPCDRASGERCFTIARDAECEDTETQLAFQLDGGASNETLIVTCDVNLDAPVHRPSDDLTRAPE